MHRQHSTCILSTLTASSTHLKHQIHQYILKNVKKHKRNNQILWFGSSSAYLFSLFSIFFLLRLLSTHINLETHQNTQETPDTMQNIEEMEGELCCGLTSLPSSLHSFFLLFLYLSLSTASHYTSESRCT